MPEITVEGKEIVDRDVKEFGDSSHVTLPKTWRGAKVKVIRMSDPQLADEDGIDLLRQSDGRLVVKDDSENKAAFLEYASTDYDDTIPSVDLDNISSVSEETTFAVDASGSISKHGLMRLLKTIKMSRESVDDFSPITVDEIRNVISELNISAENLDEVLDSLCDEGLIYEMSEGEYKLT